MKVAPFEQPGLLLTPASSSAPPSVRSPWVVLEFLPRGLHQRRTPPASSPAVHSSPAASSSAPPAVRSPWVDLEILRLGLHQRRPPRHDAPDVRRGRPRAADVRHRVHGGGVLEDVALWRERTPL